MSSTTLPHPEKPSGAWVCMGLHSIGTTDEGELSEIALMRLTCHALVQRLADRGLGEALETLQEMVKCYEQPVAVPQPLPGGESRPITMTFVGTRVETYPVILELD